MQVLVPLHAPDQPTKRDPDDARAVNVTRWPFRPRSTQLRMLEPQLNLGEEEETVPAPVPLLRMMTWGRLKTASTLRDDVNDTVHVPVPLQAPDHPANHHPDAARAVRVTVLP